MRNFVVAFAILLMLNPVSAWDELGECNDEYNDLQDNYRECKDERDDYERDIEDLEDNITDMERDNRKDKDDALQWQRNLDQCNAMASADERVMQEKEKSISALASERDVCKQDLRDYQTKIENCGKEEKDEVKKLKDQITFINDELLTCNSKKTDVEISLKQAQHDYNISAIKNVGTCNEYLAHNYYQKWQELSQSEKECLSEVLKHERVAFLTTDGKDSIMLMCETSWTYAVRYLETYEELGFIERDSKSQYTVEKELDAEAQKFLKLAGIFKPVDLTRGCTQRFQDMDDIYTNGKNWGYYMSIFWLVFFSVIALIGKGLIERVQSSY